MPNAVVLVTLCMLVACVALVRETVVMVNESYIRQEEPTTAVALFAHE